MIDFMFIQKLAIVFLIGFWELFLCTINYKFTQRNRMVASAITTMIYVYMWAYIVATIFDDKVTGFYLLSSYAIGCGCGDFLALYYDDVIDKHITRLKRKKPGRKKKRGKFYGKKK